MKLQSLLLSFSEYFPRYVLLSFQPSYDTAIHVSLHSFLKQKNDISIVRVVLTDKACAEMVAVESVFTSAKLYLCHFHVLQAMQRRLEEAQRKTRMLKDRFDEIMGFFRDALFTTDREVFDACAQLLCDIGKFSHL